MQREYQVSDEISAANLVEPKRVTDEGLEPISPNEVIMPGAIVALDPGAQTSAFREHIVNGALAVPLIGNRNAPEIDAE